MHKCINKVIVFDLDDTIGHFEEISMFLNGLQLIVGKHITDKYLFKLLNLWPKFLRPGIIETLSTIKRAKKRDKCIKAVIYTNNMGPRSWTLLIKRYLEKKIGGRIFDKVITAYRPHSKQNCRTTHSKTYADLVRCTKYGKNAEFIFLDDQFHPMMKHEKVKYLHLYPYNYGMLFKNMIKTFMDSSLVHIIHQRDRIRFKNYMYKYLTSGTGDNKYRVRRSKIHKKDIQQLRIIRKELHKFLNIHSTRNKRRRTKHKTRKNYD